MRVSFRDILPFSVYCGKLLMSSVNASYGEMPRYNLKKGAGVVYCTTFHKSLTKPELALWVRVSWPCWCSGVRKPRGKKTIILQIKANGYGNMQNTPEDKLSDRPRTVCAWHREVLT